MKRMDARLKRIERSLEDPDAELRAVLDEISTMMTEQLGPVPKQKSGSGKDWAQTSSL